MTLALAVEIALTVLLAATLIYCAILERRLAALRKGQDGFKDTIAELNKAIAAAGTSMRLLKSSAAGAVETLDERLVRARNLIDELDLLGSSGERIAQRIEKGATGERTASAGTPAVLANRLDALRRSDAPRSASLAAAAMGNVR
jgi:hypothetical protein